MTVKKLQVTANRGKDCTNGSRLLCFQVLDSSLAVVPKLGLKKLRGQGPGSPQASATTYFPCNDAATTAATNSQGFDLCSKLHHVLRHISEDGVIAQQPNLRAPSDNASRGGLQ